MIDEVQLKHFFSVLRAKREAFAENYAYFSPQLAPRFNCFDFIQPDEMMLSKILATLLNPKENHAQGELFLKLFFDAIDINYPNEIKVACEISTDKIENTQRRIDILVSFEDSYGLAIENKPWANDQNQQLSDYTKQMQKKFGDNWCLVYLSGDYSDPSENSATLTQIKEWESKKQYRKISFTHILTWLTKCKAVCQSDHVRHFLQDFIGYCELKFLGVRDMTEAELIKDFILKPENMELAFFVEKQVLAVKRELFGSLEKNFKDKLPNWQLKRKGDYITFVKPDCNYGIGVCAGTKYSYIYIGIINNTGSFPNEIRNDLEDIFQLGKASQEWKGWYITYKVTSVESWLDIQSESKVEKIIDLAKAIINEAEGISAKTTNVTTQ